VESLPRNILADTGPLFALIHARDADHERAVQFAGSFSGHLITTWPVLTEVSYLLEQSDRRGIGILLGMVLDGHLLTADLDARDVEYVRRLTAKYDNMDLADASLVAVGERLGILDVITLDRHDFSRYRTRNRRAFTNRFPTPQ
jgi:predicted nucleic acid-binding protein